MKNAQMLLDEFAGTGIINPNKRGGLKEDIDFKRVIGIYKTPDGNFSKETTRGQIRYSKHGLHIVPSYPY